MNSKEQPHSLAHSLFKLSENKVLEERAENTKLLRLLGNNVLWYRCREILSISLLVVYSLQGRSSFHFTFYQRTCVWFLKPE